MGLFDKISRGISRGISNAVGNATQRAVEKKATEVIAPKINEAADNLVKTSSATNEAINSAGGTGVLEAALNNYATAASGYATRAAANMKICPKCETPNTADKKFCSKCGSALPENTLAQSAVCTECGKQNNVGETFCSGCGAKLPFAIEQENKQRSLDQQALNDMAQTIPAYPVWSVGGNKYNFENMGDYYVFSAKFANYDEANEAVKAYRRVLIQHGFATAEGRTDEEHLYKNVDGVYYHVDTEHCFEGDSNWPSVYFNKQNPPEPPKKKKKGLFGLFG